MTKAAQLHKDVVVVVKEEVKAIHKVKKSIRRPIGRGWGWANSPYDLMPDVTRPSAPRTISVEEYMTEKAGK